MRYLSPLRYPGGKARLARFFSDLIKAQHPRPRYYAEPYAGGAGAALNLLYRKDVDHIYINDINPGIAAFWRAATSIPNDLIKLIRSTPVTITEWEKQRDIYKTGDTKDDLKLGFSTFFLNRTNRSGIINARPIGGLQQTGKWKIDARYNKENLIERINAISKLSPRITVTQKDGVDFINDLQDYGQDLFLYADPPYVVQGGRLYHKAFNTDAHHRLADTLRQVTHPWVLTYDDEPLIWNRLYRDDRIARFNIAHTAQHSHIGKETIVYSPYLNLPADIQITPGVTGEWIPTTTSS